jgi:hypothetical protein
MLIMEGSRTQCGGVICLSVRKNILKPLKYKIVSKFSGPFPFREKILLVTITTYTVNPLKPNGNDTYHVL